MKIFCKANAMFPLKILQTCTMSTCKQSQGVSKPSPATRAPPGWKHYQSIAGTSHTSHWSQDWQLAPNISTLNYTPYKLCKFRSTIFSNSIQAHNISHYWDENLNNLIGIPKIENFWHKNTGDSKSLGLSFIFTNITHVLEKNLSQNAVFSVKPDMNQAAENTEFKN